MAEKYLTYTGLKTYDGLIKDWTDKNFGGTIKGYYDNGEFYEHEIHASEDALVPQKNFLYVDLSDNNRLYMYNGDEYETVSDSGSAEVTLGDATVDCGGITKGTDLSGMGLQEILEALLSPYVAPKGISVTPITTKTGYIEHGDSNTISTIRVSWTNGSLPIQSITISGDASMVLTPSEGATYMVADIDDITFTTGTKRFTATLAVANHDSISANGSVSNNYVYPIYHGVVGVTADSLVASDIQSSTKALSAGVQTYSYTMSDSYPMIASTRRLTKVTDSSGITDYTNAFKSSETEISLSSVNPAWGPVTYYVYTGSRATLDAFQFKFTF